MRVRLRALLSARIRPCPARASWRRARRSRARARVALDSPSARVARSSPAARAALRSAGRCGRAAGPTCARDSARPASGVQRQRAATRSPSVAARTRIHRRDELELRRKLRLARRARDRDAARFERLAQHLEHVAVELRQLVEEQHAVMRERDLARPRIAAAADQRHRRRGVVRRAKRRAASSRRRRSRPGDRAHRGDLQRFVFRHRRQHAGQALRQHRLAGARRPDQQQVMAAGRRDLERAPRLRLAAHVGEIRRIAARAPRSAAALRRIGSGSRAGEMRADLEQRVARRAHRRVARPAPLRRRSPRGTTTRGRRARALQHHRAARRGSARSSPDSASSPTNS